MKDPKRFLTKKIYFNRKLKRDHLFLIILEEENSVLKINYNNWTSKISNDMRPKIKYDPKSNILSIRLSRKKSVDSDIKRNIVIDYGENGEIVNIEIMKISIEGFTRAKRPIPLKDFIKV